jgi:acyl-coenzyme A synthetase/AMP-(fatty) acid ligase
MQPLWAPDTERSTLYRSEGYWRPDRLTDHVRDRAKAAGSAGALVDENGRLTWAETWGLVQRSAAALARHGVQAGDIVSTQLPNTAAIVVLHLAVELVGAIHNPVAVQFREYELNQLDGLLGTRLMIHPDDAGDIPWAEIHAGTAAGKRGASIPAGRVFGFDEPLPAAPLEESPASASEVGFILNTSGTVSVKGVMHTHEEALFSTRTVAEIVDLGPEDTVLCAIPMTWGGGLAWGIRVAFHTGAKLVCMTRWDPRRAADMIEKEGVTFTYGPPTLARDLVGLSGEWRPSHPLRMICAGAPIPRQLCRDARNDLGMSLIPGYGQTEHLHSTLGRLDDPEEKLTGTDGSRLQGVELQAVAEDGSPRGPGEPGELLCRGPNVSVGYFGMPELTEEVYRSDGWQVTNDLGAFDADGYLNVVGRTRDIIIRGGLNVSPREVEELLLRHPDIKDAAVVGYADPRYGERICAFVVPAGPAVVTVQDLSAALTELGVAKYKHPERIEAIDALPLTTTGKVRHETLREQLRAQS